MLVAQLDDRLDQLDITRPSNYPLNQSIRITARSDSTINNEERVSHGSILGANGELSGSQSGWRGYSPSSIAKGSNDLFGRANQRAVGLIGRVATRNSPYGRAQRDRTLKSAAAVRRPLH